MEPNGYLERPEEFCNFCAVLWFVCPFAYTDIYQHTDIQYIIHDVCRVSWVVLMLMLGRSGFQ